MQRIITEGKTSVFDQDDNNNVSDGEEIVPIPPTPVFQSPMKKNNKKKFTGLDEFDRGYVALSRSIR